MKIKIDKLTIYVKTFLSPLWSCQERRSIIMHMKDLDQLLTYEGKPIPPKRRKKLLYRKREKLKPTKETLEEIKKLARVFCTHREIAAKLGITEHAWRTFREEHPEILEFIDDQALKTRADLRTLGVGRARKGDFKYWNTIAKKELGWSSHGESNIINVVPPQPKPEDIPDDIGSDPNEAAKIYQKLMG